MNSKFLWLFIKKKLCVIYILFYPFISMAEPFEIIPKPNYILVQNGFYVLTSGQLITYSHDSLFFSAQFLARKLNQSTGFLFNPKKDQKGGIELQLNKEYDQRLGSEGYRLLVTKKKIFISANNPAGIFYGVQTLLQLLPPEVESNQKLLNLIKLPLVEIIDYPQFTWRGAMLDVSRHFFSKDEVKNFIDLMAKYKLNVFHWHLTDDHGWRIEIKALPRLTEIGAWRVERSGPFGERKPPLLGEKATYGGYYTHDDIREIVQYAAERYITIVPEIDVPGHSMAAIAAYPELCVTRDTTIKVDPGTRFAEWFEDGTFRMNIDNTLNPSSEKVYEFLDKVFTEVAELFPGEYIHVGGDECYKGFWLKDTGCINLMKKLNFNHAEQLQHYFIERVERIVQSKGKKIIGWDEIYNENLSKNSAIMCWRNPIIGFDAAKKGYKVVMSPTSFCYLDYYQGDPSIEPPVYAGLRLSTCYRFNPLSDTLNSTYILGGQGNLWTENIPNFSTACYMLFPRLWALSEVFWTNPKNKSWESFIERVEKQFKRLDYANINYSRAIYDPIISCQIIKNNNDTMLYITMFCEAPNVEIRYTIDNTMPTLYSPEYTTPITVPDENITLRVRTYRNNQPIGNLIILSTQQLLGAPYLNR